jgi:molybdopterin synthase sulfur carrier subunit
MKVSVKFYAHLQDLVNKKGRLAVELDDGATIVHLLEKLFLDAKIREHLLNKNGAMRSEITIVINGREIRFLDGMNTVLEHTDEVSFFPAVAGG